MTNETVNGEEDTLDDEDDEEGGDGGEDEGEGEGVDDDFVTVRDEVETNDVIVVLE